MEIQFFNGGAIVMAFHAEYRFLGGGFTLVPKGFTAPSVGPLNAAGVGTHPAVVAQGTVQAEELYMPKAFADVAEEMETKIFPI